jgi:hypothetical protein
VAVAQVPAVDVAAEGGAVILLRVDDEPRILLGVEDAVRVDIVVATLGGKPLQLDELVDGRLLARLGVAEQRGVCVQLRVAAEVVEAGVPVACLRGDRREAVLFDQPLRDLGALLLELVRSVRRPAE